jgi:hypothetical protein
VDWGAARCSALVYGVCLPASIRPGRSGYQYLGDAPAACPSAHASDDDRVQHLYLVAVRALAQADLHRASRG